MAYGSPLTELISTRQRVQSMGANSFVEKLWESLSVSFPSQSTPNYKRCPKHSRNGLRPSHIDIVDTGCSGQDTWQDFTSSQPRQPWRTFRGGWVGWAKTNSKSQGSPFLGEVRCFAYFRQLPPIENFYLQVSSYSLPSKVWYGSYGMPKWPVEKVFQGRLVTLRLDQQVIHPSHIPTAFSLGSFFFLLSDRCQLPSTRSSVFR